MPVSFSEGNATKTVSPLEFTKSLIGALPAAVQFGEHMPASTAGAAVTSIEGLTDKQLNQVVLNYMDAKNVSYAEAHHALANGATFTFKA